MIYGIFRAFARLDHWLQETIGAPYRALLGVGLVIEIGKSLRQFPDLLHSHKGLIGEAMALVLFVALFINQLAEFYERLAARRERRSHRSRP